MVREDLQVGVLEDFLVGAVDQFDDAEDMVLAAHRHAEDRLGDEGGGAVELVGKALVLANVGDHQRFAVLGDPAGNPLAGGDLHPLELFGRRRDGDLKGQVAGLLVAQQQRPGLGLEQTADLIHDQGQHVLKLDGRRQSLADLDENFKLAVASLQSFQQMGVS